MSQPDQRNPLRVAAAQFDAVSGDLPANVAEHARLLDRAGACGTDVLVFPELSLSGYATDILSLDAMRCAIDPEGPDLAPIRDACRRNAIVAVVGGAISGDRGLCLSAMVIDRQGRTCASYDKQYLDGPEKDWFTPGASGCLIEVDGWRLALGICYDASFPEHARALALEGADAYLVSGAFPLGASDHRRTVYFPARALENTLYVAFANYIGAHAGLGYGGRSAIYGPDGRRLADAGPDQGAIAMAELDPNTLRQARATTEMLRDRLAETSPIHFYSAN